MCPGATKQGCGRHRPALTWAPLALWADCLLWPSHIRTGLRGGGPLKSGSPAFPSWEAASQGARTMGFGSPWNNLTF